MAFKITENKDYMGITLDSIYSRVHIQVTLNGDVIAKPLFYSNENAYKAKKGNIKSWFVEIERTVKTNTVEDFKNKIKETIVKERKDICLLYLKLGPIEDFKKLVPEVNSKVIKELLAIGFISNKKNVKIV